MRRSSFGVSVSHIAIVAVPVGHPSMLGIPTMGANIADDGG